MEASCESAKRDGLRPRVLGNVVKIIIKAVTTPYYLFVRLTRVPATPRAAVQGSLCAPPEVAIAPVRLINIMKPCSLIELFRERSNSAGLVRKADCKGYKWNKEAMNEDRSIDIIVIANPFLAITGPFEVSRRNSSYSSHSARRLFSVDDLNARL